MSMSEITEAKHRKERPPRWVLFTMILAVLGFVIWGTTNQYMTTQKSQALEQNVQELTGNINDWCASHPKQELIVNGIDVCKQSENVKQNPTDPVAAQKGEKGDKGDPPSKEEISAAVTAYCAANRCQGSDGTTPSTADVMKAVAASCGSASCKGPAGAPAEPVTAEQLNLAVAAYCTDGRCAGADGQPGPGPTAEQISAAVADFCSTGACKGEKGDSVPQTITAAWRCADDGTAILIINNVETPSPLKCPKPDPEPTPVPTETSAAPTPPAGETP